LIFFRYEAMAISFQSFLGTPSTIPRGQNCLDLSQSLTKTHWSLEVSGSFMNDHHVQLQGFLPILSCLLDGKQNLKTSLVKEVLLSQLSKMNSMAAFWERKRAIQNIRLEHGFMIVEDMHSVILLAKN
jgi:hypothetical protein